LYNLILKTRYKIIKYSDDFFCLETNQLCLANFETRKITRYKINRIPKPITGAIINNNAAVDDVESMYAKRSNV